MPAKNIKKFYIENSFYHLYNRSIQSAQLFLDSDDYSVMLNLLQKYLDPEKKIEKKSGLINPMNLSDNIELLCFCLMPNHFHLLIFQKHPHGITFFTRRVLTSYALYYNYKYKRHGSIFEGKLKGVLVESDSYLLHLSRYIHRNPFRLLQESESLSSYKYSSYPYYAGTQSANWIKTEKILNFFQNAKKDPLYNFSSYEEFVELFPVDSGQILGSITLDDKNDKD